MQRQISGKKEADIRCCLNRKPQWYNSPACKTITMAKNCITTDTEAMILNGLGRILCCPPIVNSPSGNPQAARIVITTMIKNKLAPNTATIHPYHLLFRLRSVKSLELSPTKRIISHILFMTVSVSFAQIMRP